MRLIKTSLFSAIITIIKTAAGFVSSKFVAIYAGPAGVALVGQFVNFLSIIFTFANGAINNGVVKYTAQYAAAGNIQQLKLLHGTAAKLTIVCSGAISFILILASKKISFILFGSAEYYGPIRVTGVGTVFYALNLLIISIVNGYQKIKLYTKINVIGSIVSLLFTVILIYFYNIEGALYALAFSQSVLFFITLALLKKNKYFNLKLILSKMDKEILQKLSSFSLMAITTAVTMPLAQLFLRNYIISNFSVSSAGYWQGLMRISDAYLLIITTALSTYYLPKLSSINDDKELREEIFSGYKLIIPAVGFSCAIIFFLKDFLISLLYSSDFYPMRQLFLYQLVGDFFKIAAWILAYLMLAKALTKIYIITEVVFTFTYIVLSVYCMNIFGLQGITIAFGINYLLYFLIMILIFRKLLFNK